MSLRCAALPRSGAGFGDARPLAAEQLPGMVMLRKPDDFFAALDEGNLDDTLW